MTHHVVYLTGAPASGKSTLSRELREQVPNLAVFEYGERLTQYLSKRDNVDLSQEEIRRRSAGIATAEDIAAVDQLLLGFIAANRTRAPVLIDSHAVTKESFGFRVTPYSLTDITALDPTLLVMLYTNPSVTTKRIDSSPAGRPAITEWEAGFHAALQATVAIGYAMAVGIPVYLFDSARPTQPLAREIKALIERPPRSKDSRAGS